MNKIVYCITTIEKWEHAKSKGIYLDESLNNEGFIHCSFSHQLVRVANKHFNGINNLLILCINCKHLKSNIIDEDLYNLNELYPHIYGPINVEAVIKTVAFSCNRDGSFSLPEKINKI